MFVIGVAGQAQNGKDTLADYLVEVLNERLVEKEMGAGNFWRRTAFADNVKKVYEDTFDRDRAFIEEWKTNPNAPPGFDMTVRKSLQFIGDGFRKICPSIWVDLVFRRVDAPIIISDVRYVNEFKRVRKEGGLNILIGKSDRLNDDPNGSEAQIRPYVKFALDYFPADLPVVEVKNADTMGLSMEDFDLFVRNDGSVNDLYDAIDEFVVPYVEKFSFTTEE